LSPFQQPPIFVVSLKRTEFDLYSGDLKAVTNILHFNAQKCILHITSLSTGNHFYFISLEKQFEQKKINAPRLSMYSQKMEKL
jgi:hypothetical protein